MTDNSVDQITKEPETITPQKDPKKVAAGKKLAEYHKKAKMALEAEKNNSTEEETTGKSWVPEISSGTVIALVGISLTAFDLYMRLRTPPTVVVQQQPTTEQPKPQRTVGMQ